MIEEWKITAILRVKKIKDLLIINKESSKTMINKWYNLLAIRKVIYAQRLVINILAVCRLYKIRMFYSYKNLIVN